MEGGGGMKNSDLSVEELQIDQAHHHHGHHQSNPHPDNSNNQDDDQYLLQQMLSSDLSNCSWPHDLIISNSSSSNPNPNTNPSNPHLDPHQQQQLLLPLSLAADHPMDPRRLFADSSSFKSIPQGGEGAVDALYNGFPAGPLHGNGASSMGQQPFEKFEGKGGGAGSASTGTGSRQRVRARRGQATDPHSIAERLRRERIAERMKGLQQLVPNANKTDKASMLDEIIDYVKFLQVQVKVLSMSRLGGRPPLPPLLAGLASEGGSGGGGGIGGSSNGGQEGGPTSDSMAITEQQVVKLMEEDMGSAMQYLQGKGLCLMPISLATAISTATHHQPSNGGGARPSPVLGGSSVVNGDGSAKDSSTPNPKA